MTYKTDSGFQGVDGIMADFGIQSFSNFSTEQEITDYFQIENIVRMFGPGDLTQARLDEIAAEFITAWDDDDETYTLVDLASLVADQEREQAPGSETILLGGFVSEFGYVSNIIDDDKDDPIPASTYRAWEAAYKQMAEFEANGTDYTADMLF